MKHIQVCPNDGYELIAVSKRFNAKLKCPKCGLRFEKESDAERGEDLFSFMDHLKNNNTRNIDLNYEG